MTHPFCKVFVLISRGLWLHRKPRHLCRWWTHPHRRAPTRPQGGQPNMEGTKTDQLWRVFLSAQMMRRVITSYCEMPIYYHISSVYDPRSNEIGFFDLSRSLLRCLRVSPWVNCAAIKFVLKNTSVPNRSESAVNYHFWGYPLVPSSFGNASFPSRFQEQPFQHHAGPSGISTDGWTNRFICMKTFVLASRCWNVLFL